MAHGRHALAYFLVLGVSTSDAFTTIASGSRSITTRPAIIARTPPPRAEEFTEVQRLRAEAESPFSQIRLFILPALFAAASIATYFALTGLLASAAGLREASPTAATDIAIDLGSMAAIGALWRRELQARESRLKRIAFGSQLASLRVFTLVPDAEVGLRPGPSVSLADLRRGRGQARRVVLTCAPEETLRASLAVACASASRLADADYLVVPLLSTGDSSSPAVTPPPLTMMQELASASGAALTEAFPATNPVKTTTQAQPALPWDEALPDAAVGWPIAMAQSGGAAWTSALSAELTQAAKQDAEIMQRGLTIVLKKNGRVSNRRLGTPDWPSLVEQVEGRKRAGMDVVNI